MFDSRILYSTVIDNTENFLLQGYLWARSLIENANVNPWNIVVNVVDDHTLDLNALRSLDINIALSPRFGDGRYCNKAGQIDGLRKYESDYFALMDADIFVIYPIPEIYKNQRLSGKIVDLANPRIAVLDELFMEANFIARPKITKADIEKNKSTYKSNLNGGFYVIPVEHINPIDNAWKKWILWILDHPDSLSQVRKLHHTDQIAFSMALTELEIDLNPLSREYNFPCHLFIEEDCSPKILHYHHLLSETGITNLNPHLHDYSLQLEQVNLQICNWIRDFKLK